MAWKLLYSINCGWSNFGVLELNPLTVRFSDGDAP